MVTKLNICEIQSISFSDDDEKNSRMLQMLQDANPEERDAIMLLDTHLPTIIDYLIDVINKHDDIECGHRLCASFAISLISEWGKYTAEVTCQDESEVIDQITTFVCTSLKKEEGE